MAKEYIKAKNRVKLTAGDVIRIAREMLDMNQAQLAKKAGLQQSHLSEIENGKREIGRAVAKRLGDALNISPANILFVGEEPREGVISEEMIESVVSALRSQKKKVDNLLARTQKTLHAGADKIPPKLRQKLEQDVDKAREINELEDITGFHVIAKKALETREHK